MQYNVRLSPIFVSALTGIAGCSDPTEPAVESSGARLTVEVYVYPRFATDADLTARVRGSMTPGRDPSGKPREVEAPLRVAAQSIDLFFPVRSDWATIETVVPLSPVNGLATFTVEAPSVRGVQPTIAVATISTMRLVERDTVTARTDGSLTLHPQIVPATDSATAPTTRQWALTVTGKTSIAFDVTGPVPAEIVVPRELMPPPSISGWAVQFGVTDTYGPPAFPRPGGDYDVIVRLSQGFYRTFLPPTPAASR